MLVVLDTAHLTPLTYLAHKWHAILILDETDPVFITGPLNGHKINKSATGD